MQKVQLFGPVLEGALVACKGNFEQQNSLEARINFIENLVVKVSSDIISLTSVVKENSDTLKMLNANVNMLMKHVVDNETKKSNKHMTDACATTYIAHPSKSSEKKRKKRIIAKHDFLKEDIRAANELTKSIRIGGLNVLHKEDKKVNVNRLQYYLVLQMQDYDEVEIESKYTFPQSMVDTLNDEE
ncbi:hypothetical protein Cgig2_004355 [Carnegiea gigantea]|uniref:Uncharacterized protein n=1 Tax=Carnegiea gigantea TaxID=171969 RepID=A0A9Q1GW15_9CARY|nr:hypothetical protein Cgig2_004355 [Carnegiea gigantea]